MQTTKLKFVVARASNGWIITDEVNGRLMLPRVYAYDGITASIQAHLKILMEELGTDIVINSMAINVEINHEILPF